MLLHRRLAAALAAVAALCALGGAPAGASTPLTEAVRGSPAEMAVFFRKLAAGAPDLNAAALSGLEAAAAQTRRQAAVAAEAAAAALGHPSGGAAALVRALDAGVALPAEALELQRAVAALHQARGAAAQLGAGKAKAHALLGREEEQLFQAFGRRAQASGGRVLPAADGSALPAAAARRVNELVLHLATPEGRADEAARAEAEKLLAPGKSHAAVQGLLRHALSHGETKKSKPAAAPAVDPDTDVVPDAAPAAGGDKPTYAGAVFDDAVEEALRAAVSRSRFSAAPGSKVDGLPVAAEALRAVPTDKVLHAAARLVASGGRISPGFKRVVHAVGSLGASGPSSGRLLALAWVERFDGPEAHETPGGLLMGRDEARLAAVFLARLADPKTRAALEGDEPRVGELFPGAGGDWLAQAADARFQTPFLARVRALVPAAALKACRGSLNPFPSPRDLHAAALALESRASWHKAVAGAHPSLAELWASARADEGAATDAASLAREMDPLAAAAPAALDNPMPAEAEVKLYAGLWAQRVRRLEDRLDRVRVELLHEAARAGAGAAGEAGEQHARALALAQARAQSLELELLNLRRVTPEQYATLHPPASREAEFVARVAALVQKAAEEGAAAAGRSRKATEAESEAATAAAKRLAEAGKDMQAHWPNPATGHLESAASVIAERRDAVQALQAAVDALAKQLADGAAGAKSLGAAAAFTLQGDSDAVLAELRALAWHAEAAAGRVDFAKLVEQLTSGAEQAYLAEAHLEWRDMLDDVTRRLDGVSEQLPPAQERLANLRHTEGAADSLKAQETLVDSLLAQSEALQKAANALRAFSEESFKDQYQRVRAEFGRAVEAYEKAVSTAVTAAEEGADEVKAAAAVATAAEPKAEPVAEPAAEPVTDPKAEPVAEPNAEPDAHHFEDEVVDEEQ